MIIRSIVIENFGRFSSRTFEFRRGMNLVTGPNEAGKSTLAEVIPAVLFGSNQVDRFRPWGRSGCSAQLVFERSGRTVEIRRDLLNDEVRLTERDDLYQTLSGFEGRVPLRGRSSMSREYRDLLEGLLGVAEDDLFRATCFFGQRVAEWTGDELGGKLRSLVSGCDETDFSVILDSLLEEHFQLTRENPWGRDKQRDRELELLQKRIEASSHSRPATFSLDTAEDPADLDERIRQLSAELEHDRSEYVKGVCYVDRLRQNRPSDDPAPRSEAERPKASGQPAAADAREALRERLAAAGLPQDPPPDLPDILQRAARIRQELAEVQRPLSLLAQNEGKLKQVPWLMIGIITLLLAATLVAGVGFHVIHWGLAAAGGGVIAGLLGWGAAGSLRRRRRLEDFKKQRVRLEQTRADALERQKELSETCKASGLPATAVDLVRLQKVADANLDLLNEWWALGKTAQAEDVVDPGAGSNDVREEEEEEETASEAVASKELAELEERLAAFAAQLKVREAELVRLKHAAAASQQSSTDDTEADPTAALQQSCRQMQRRIAVLRMAVDLLVDGVEDFRQTHLVRLTAEAGRLFSLMTGGRYMEIRLDAEMRPQIKVDGRRWQPADRFSRGTLDALYLALRIAMSRVRGDGHSLPLVLDDPFVHMDKERQTATLRLLDAASAGGQMIVLSHNEDLARRAARERWHVISLGEEDAGVSAKDEDYAGQLHLL